MARPFYSGQTLGGDELEQAFVDVDEAIATVGGGLDITGLTTATPVDADSIAFYDTSAAANRKGTLTSLWTLLLGAARSVAAIWTFNKQVNISPDTDGGNGLVITPNSSSATGVMLKVMDNTNTYPVLEIMATDDAGAHFNRTAQVDRSADSLNDSPTFQGRRTRGTYGAPTAVLADARLVQLSGTGHDGNDFSTQAALIALAGQDWAPGVADVFEGASVLADNNCDDPANLSDGNPATNATLNSHGDITFDLGAAHVFVGFELDIVSYSDAPAAGDSIKIYGSNASDMSGAVLLADEDIPGAGVLSGTISAPGSYRYLNVLNDNGAITVASGLVVNSNAGGELGTIWELQLTPNDGDVLASYFRFASTGAYFWDGADWVALITAPTAPPAFTQTYSTTADTVAPASTAAFTATPASLGDAATLSDVEQLRGDLITAYRLINSLIDALQDAGIAS